ncbi:hypothetical protein N9B92_01010 [Porticoccaceae bacterium]|nr:hypothetical protein [Porticoccaceae bacterium]
MAHYPFKMSAKIKAKLADKHQVTAREVAECFYNRTSVTLIDNRESHRTDPPTEWFIAKTDRGRQLKIIFILVDGVIYLKSAFEADKQSIRIYKLKVNQHV